MTPQQLAAFFGIIILLVLFSFYGLCCACYGLYRTGREAWRIYRSHKGSLL